MMPSTKSFAETAGTQRAVHHDAHVVGFLLHQTLGGEHVLYLARADAVGETGEGAVGRGMGITAHHRHAGQGRALLGPDHVHDALTVVIHLELHDAVLVAVRIQGIDLELGNGIADTAVAIGGRHIVVGDREVRIDTPGLAIRRLQPVEGLGRGHLVEQMAIDVEDGGAIVVSAHLVGTPELIVEGLSGHRMSSSSGKAAYCNGSRAFTGAGSGAGTSTKRHTTNSATALAAAAPSQVAVAPRLFQAYPASSAPAAPPAPKLTLL